MSDESRIHRTLLAAGLVSTLLAIGATARATPSVESRAGEYLLNPRRFITANASAATTFGLGCGEFDGAKKTKSNAGSFRLVFEGFVASPGDDPTLRIFDNGFGFSADALLDEMKFGDLVSAAGPGGVALSRPIWVKFDGDGDEQCPNIKIVFTSTLAGSDGAARIEVGKVRFSYQEPAKAELAPQGDMHNGRSDSILSVMNGLSTKEMIPTKEMILDFARSVARVDVQLGTSKPINCTGFLIGDDRLLTNHHCVHSDKADDPEVCRGFTAHFEHLTKWLGRDEWRCENILIKNEALDFAVVEIKKANDGDGQTRKPATLALEEFKGPPSKIMQDDKDYSVMLLHHMNGNRLQASYDCDAPARLAKADLYSLGLQNIAQNEATLLHGCDSEKGSSGAPLIAVSAVGVSVIGLHYSDAIQDDLKNAGVVQCYETFIKDNFPGFELRNLAFDASSIRCAIEAASSTSASSSCRAVAIESGAPDKKMMDDLRKKWKEHRAEICRQ